MAKTYPCPSCRGAGTRPRIDAESEADCVEECSDCDSTGRVSKAERDEIQACIDRCRGPKKKPQRRAA